MDGSLSRLDNAKHPPTSEGVALDYLRLGWRPIVGRDRRILGVRIEIGTAPSTAEATSASTLGAVIGALADQASTLPRGLIVFAPGESSLESDLTTLTAWSKKSAGKSGLMLEVAAESLSTRQWPLIEAAHREGMRFVLRKSAHSPPRDWQRLFAAVVSAGDGKIPAGESAPPLWVRDTYSRADVESALAKGAQATIGWPLDEPTVEASAGLEPTRRAVLDIVRLIQSDADVIALERAFKNEPSLALMLLSVINGPAFASGAAHAAPITSIRHAILVLGYKRLVRWLVLLLGVSCASTRSMPLVYMAVQRGFFLEALANHIGGMRDDLFAVGAFSLLQQITGHSHERLFASAALPRPVLDAVRAHEGAYGVYLALAEVIERGDAVGSERAAQLVGVSMGEINAALLSSLAAADAITMN